MNCTSPGIVCAVYKAANPGMNQRARTHRARLNCNKEFTVNEAVITEALCRFAQGHDLGVSRRVIACEIAIGPAADDAPLEYNNGANRDFARCETALRTTDALFHPDLVVGPGVGFGCRADRQWHSFL